MTKRRLLSITLVALITLLVGMAGTVAQDPAPGGVAAMQTTVDTTFTFQGHLEDGGSPLTDTCDFQFQLYDDAAAGSQVGATLTENGVAVSDGKFTVLLDFGSSAFYGDARFLQIAVRCSGDAGFVDLSGRVALTATPHAISLMPGATVAGDLGSTAALYLANYGSSGLGPVLYATNASTSAYASAVHGAMTHPFPGQDSAGIRGSCSGTEASCAGVWGSHAAAGIGVFGTADSGTGVLGYAQSTIAYNRGVLGKTNSPLGMGVSGQHVSQSGVGPGVKGETFSTSDEAAGVLGQVASTSPGAFSAGVRGINDGTGVFGTGVYGSQAGSGWGVYGTAPDGIGVYGVHASESGTEPGVKGETHSASNSAVGVLGRVTSTPPGSYSAGVRGINEGTGGFGIGVYGSQEGGGWGVYGTTPDGIGVYGLHDGTTGAEPGVKGETESTDASAVGVLGRVTSTSPGPSSAGVQGLNEGTGTQGIGVHGEHKGGGWGVYGVSDWGYAGYFSGDVMVAGTCTGCALAYIGLNDGDEPLETGDLVTVSGVSNPLAGMTTPVLRLRRVDASNAGAVVGVVQTRARLVGRQSNVGRDLDNIVRAEGSVAPGDHLFIVVQGMVQVKVDAGNGAIQAGDDLVVLGTLSGHAGRASDNRESRRIGRAMENLAQGVGLIWVMVGLQ
jgi:hypothetical protein